MTSRRAFPQGNNMFGGSRSSRGILDPRDGGVTVSHSMPRRANAFDERLSRGKAAVDDVRSGRDVRVPGFISKAARGIDQAEGSGYGNMERRSTFRDELGPMKMMRSNEAIRNGGDSHRLRDGGIGSRVERTSHRSEHGDEPKWARNGGKYGGLNSHDGAGSLRSSGSEFVAPTGNSSNDSLPGFIFESPKRLILDWSTRGSFTLSFDDRRLAEQVGPSTKVFLFDGNSRELYGVFQSVEYAEFNSDAENSSSKVRVRTVKDCLPLPEREFKAKISDNYYHPTKFTAGLTREQVSKLTQCFRPVETGRNLHLSLTSSRSSLHSGIGHTGQDLRSIPDGFSFGKEDRRRSTGLDTRPFNSHSYRGQDGGRFQSKLPMQGYSSKMFSAEAEEFDEDGTGNLPSDSTLATLTRGKQQSLRGLSGSRISATQLGTGRHSDLKLTDGEWREDDASDVVYRKRHTLSSNGLEDLKRGNRSSSPGWKEIHHSRAEATGSDAYERVGKSGYKEESPYVSTTRHVRNDIDLNIPLDMGHGEPSSSHMHEMEPKIIRRRNWDEEDDKTLSPSKGRSLVSRGSDYAIASSTRDVLNDMSPVSQKDFLRLQEKGRHSPVPLSSSFAKGKSLKPHIRPVGGVKPLTREKPGLATLLRGRESLPAREVVHSTREYPARNTNVPVFKIKANLQAHPGKGKQERVVTLLNTAKPRPPFGGADDDEDDEDDDTPSSWRDSSFDGGEDSGFRSDGRKRKASVWDRIKGPAGKSLVTKTSPPYGRGRVFSRLGPAPVLTPLADARDNGPVHKKKKMYPHQNLVWTRKVDGASEDVQEIDDIKPLDEDEHIDDFPIDILRESTEQAGGELQGWSRKKHQGVSASSGDEGGNPDVGEPGKGGRRKLVRPAIGGRFEGYELGQIYSLSTSEVDADSPLHSNAFAASVDRTTILQQGSSALMMELEMTNSELKEGTCFKCLIL